ncbi:hypothetical protein CBS14141_002824 [Malassezia furfur]|nr:hypothetical protein CBS14141_002824 [Malassezia furfur]
MVGKNPLFERTVDIVQSLPPTGAIQTSYEEKLALYGLYKQATHGDVDSRRPGMFDMLGRAKWDAWESQRGYTQQDAKQLYIESVLKVLRRFSDRPQAITLMAELEAYSGDVAEQVMDGTLAETASLHSSSVSPSTRAHGYGASVDELASSIADDAPPPPRTPHRAPMRAREADTHTGSGSHSHETVTVSDMPRSHVAHDQERAAAPLRASTNTRGARDTPRQNAWPEPKARRTRPSAGRTAPAAPPSVQSGRYSEAASRSFASAQPSLQEQQPPPARSQRGGPLGRYAPSSAGERSSGRPVVVRRAPKDNDTEQTLRAIQASLVALTERLDAPRRAELRGVAQRRSAGGPARPSLLQALLRAPFKFVAQVVSVLGRLLLDATSVVLLLSVLTAALRRLSGRGDPWVVLRLLSQASARLRFFQVAANRRAAFRALLTSALVGGVVMESRNHVS